MIQRRRSKVAYRSGVLALDADTIRTAAIVALAVLVVGGVVVAWVVRSIAQKVLGLLVIGGLVFAVWSQRSALEDCADRLVGDTTSGAAAQTCTFFGVEVDVTLSEN
jgi:hypothetical protein